MLALWLENKQLQLREDVPLPEPPPGEVRVRVLLAGICNTDVELVRGYYPYAGVLGHEFVGVVEEGPKHLDGKKVVGEINAVCGHCVACRRGRRSHCSGRTVLGIVNRHGAFAEYLCLPLENLHVVPENVSLDAATFTEPLAAALQVQQQLPVSSKDRVVVVGDGKLGQLVGQTLALSGCELLVVGRHQKKLDFLQNLGIQTGRAEALRPGDFDVAVECTGNTAGFELARTALRAGGTLVLKSTYAGRLHMDASSLVVDEITLIGSRCGPFVPALKLLAAGKVKVGPLIAARYSLRDGLAAFNRAQEAGVLKVLLSPGKVE